MRLSPRRRRLLLAAALALPLLAASQGEPPPPPPDDKFCGEAVEFNSSYLGTSMWMWLPEAEPGQPDLPPEVLNATLAQFEAEYDATAAEGWVPCPPENLDVSYYGCQNVGLKCNLHGAPNPSFCDDAYWLRLNLTCSHTEHVDSAAFEALVLVGGPWGTLDNLDIMVNITSVVLEVDASHSSNSTTQQACDDPLCTECAPGGPALPGAPPLPQTCTRCVQGFELGAATSACEQVSAVVGGNATTTPPAGGGEPGKAANPEAVTAAEQAKWVLDECKGDGQEAPAPKGDPGMKEADTTSDPRIAEACQYAATTGCFVAPSEPENAGKPCGAGFYVFSPGLRLCTRCDRPGCIDCAACTEGTAGCLGHQRCIAPCKQGFGYHDAGCSRCAEHIPGCGRCRRCAAGATASPTCHGGLECICCDAGLHFAADGTKVCVDEKGVAPALLPEAAYTPRPLPTPAPLAPPVGPQDPAKDVCLPVAGGEEQPKPSDSTANGLQSYQMMDYGCGGQGTPGAAVDCYSKEYQACRAAGFTQRWKAPAAPANPAKPCGHGFFMFNAQLRLCAMCDRPGCADCSYCQDGVADCVDKQYCLPPCVLGYSFHQGGCRRCAEFVPNCGRCSRCTSGADCHDFVRCGCCDTGFAFSTDGTRTCVAIK